MAAKEVELIGPAGRLPLADVSVGTIRATAPQFARFRHAGSALMETSLLEAVADAQLEILMTHLNTFRREHKSPQSGSSHG